MLHSFLVTLIRTLSWFYLSSFAFGAHITIKSIFISIWFKIGCICFEKMHDYCSIFIFYFWREAENQFSFFYHLSVFESLYLYKVVAYMELISCKNVLSELVLFIILKCQVQPLNSVILPPFIQNNKLTGKHFLDPHTSAKIQF